MIGLVLEGGGTKGSYEIGAYYAFKKCHIHFDGIVGTSIGTINAAFLVAGKSHELLELWKYKDIGETLGLPKEYVDAMNESTSKLKKVMVTNKTIKEIFNEKGMSMDNLRKAINDSLTEDEIRNSKMDFGLSVVRVNDLKPLYLYKDDIPKGQMIDYVLSSAHFPAFKLEKLKDGNYYVDGGFYDNSPSNMLEKKGYDTIYIVNLNGVGRKQKKIGKAKIITINPSHDLGKVLNVKEDEVRNNIAYGYYDTLKVLKQLDGYKYIFKKMNINYYKKITKNIDKKTMLLMKAKYLAKDEKEIVLKSLEEVLKKENKEFTKIYSPRYLIFKIKLSGKNKGVYNFISKLSII
jgi:NTE family protein